jgi:hypothetical protein
MTQTRLTAHDAPELRSEPLAAPDVDVDVPSVARMYDFYLGGAHNFAVDRQAAQRVIDVYPDLPRVIQANRAFLRRAVTFIADQGIDQFLDIGSGIPTAGNVHEVAQRANAAARVVYVDNDPVAVRHSRTLLLDDSRTGVVLADARATEQIFSDSQVKRLLDLARPVGVLVMGLVHFFPDDVEAYELIRRLYEKVPSGSYFALTHATTERMTDEMRRQLELVYSRTPTPIRFRTRDEIRQLLSDFELVEPGLVYLSEWRPEGPEEPFYAVPVRSNGFASVGYKP